MLNSKKYVLSISVSIILSSYLYGVTACSKDANGDYVVTNNSTGIDSLSSCVSEANNDEVDSKIIFDGDYTINLTDEISIEDDGALTIDGGANSIVINGDSDSRIFNISNTAKTTLQNLTLQNGTPQQEGEEGNSPLSGGALTTTGSDVKIQNCTITANTARDGGAIYSYMSDIEILDSTIVENSAEKGTIYHNTGTLIINGSNINFNTVSGRAGGIYGINSNVSIDDSSISNNIADSYGGMEFENTNVTITNSSVSDNNASKEMGGMYFVSGNLLIDNSIFSGNSSHQMGSGGIKIRGSSTNTIIKNSTISDNIADASGGGLLVESTNSLSIENSTISGNTAGSSAGGIGIQNVGDCSIKSSTISGNIANNDGGGIYMYSTEYGCSIESSTITNNTASSGGGIMAYADLNLTNSILSGNSATTYSDANKIESHGFNILGDIDTVTPLSTDIQTTDPKLDPLADNGGDTQTHALQKDSPAIDAGYSSIPLDQRGEDRDSSPDIGAYEYQSGWTVVPIINYLLF